MQAERLKLIRLIHKSPYKVVLATAGAGTQALSDLLSVAGASNTLLEARVPYAKNAFIDFVGREPKKFVSPIATRLLAGSAFYRAPQLTDQFPDSDNLIGLACSASIATNRPKRGDHHAWVVTWQRDQIVQVHIKLAKDRRSRSQEEKLISKIILNLLAQACGLSDQIPLNLLEQDVMQVRVRNHAKELEDFLFRKSGYLGIFAHGKTKTKNLAPKVLMPGSFNPLHQGHTELASVAEKILGQPVAFEMSVLNVDKPPLPKDVILSRIAQFAGRYPIYLTTGPTFLDKARLFPEVTFIVGFDTAERIFVSKYYDSSKSKMMAAVNEIKDLGCQFLVAGRKGKDGVYDRPETLQVPSEFSDLFIPIPDGMFRRDISSTELRSGKN